jgi:hypothetical protein
MVGREEPAHFPIPCRGRWSPLTGRTTKLWREFKFDVFLAQRNTRSTQEDCIGWVGQPLRNAAPNSEGRSFQPMAHENGSWIRVFRVFVVSNCIVPAESAEACKEKLKR